MNHELINDFDKTKLLLFFTFLVEDKPFVLFYFLLKKYKKMFGLKEGKMRDLN